MDTAAQAVAFARVLLDPTQPGLWTDGALLPYVAAAAQEARARITSREVTEVDATVMIPAIPAGVANLDQYQAPGGVLALMTGPVEILERPAGTRREDYSAIRRVETLPARPMTSRFLVYQWLGGRVLFPGATQALDLSVIFRSAWAPLTNLDSPIPVGGLVPVLGRWAAAMATEAAEGPAQAAPRMAEAKIALSTWVRGRVLDSQTVTRRQRPFSRMDDFPMRSEIDGWV